MKRAAQNTTHIPNPILDLLLPRLPEAEQRVVLYICRRTYGFGKTKDQISLTQFTNGIRNSKGILDYGTGLSRPSVVEAIKNLQGALIITIEKGRGTNTYALNPKVDIEKAVVLVHKLRISNKKMRTKRPKQARLFLVNPPNQLRGTTKNGKEALPKVVKLLNTQKKGNKGNKDGEKAKAANAVPTNEIMGTFKGYAEQIRHETPVFTRFKDGSLIKSALRHLHRFELDMLFLFFLTKKREMKTTIGAALCKEVIADFLKAASNRYGFYREMDELRQRYAPKVQFSEGQLDTMKTNMQQLKAELLKKMTLK